MRTNTSAGTGMASGMAGKWEALVLLWFAYFFYQADKQIYAVVLAPLRAELGLSGPEAGLVNTIFTLVAAVMAPVAGALGDRWPKARILTWVVVVWSAGTMLSGAVGTLAMMILTRSIVTGTAEAFYPPVAHAYIAALHDRTRAFAISIHQTAQYAGPIGSGILAGWLAEKAGWRTSFYVFGAGGILLGLWMAWRMKAEVGERAAGKVWEGFRDCARIAGVRYLGLAFAAELFVTLGYSTWAPTIFRQQYGLGLAEAGFQTSFWTMACAIGGALVGGAASDRWKARGGRRVDVQALALVVGAPFFYWLGSAATLGPALVALGAIGFCRGVYEGTIAVTLYAYVRPEHRASAAAVVLVVANLLAAPSSALLGWAADVADIQMAVRGLGVFFLAGALVLWSSRRLPLAGERLD
ncbi:MAG: MFS transporter [Bryobacter sp.]|nr:MFS transporter [Bryobacter sp.]